MIEEKYQELLEIPSDVNKHMETIRKYVTKGDAVMELGVRYCVSTWALLANKPRSLLSIDIITPPAKNLAEVEKAAKEAGIQFDFVQADSTVVEIEPAIDVLFIDTLHLYSHIVKELWRHSGRTRKYIIFHDYSIPEVASCIQDFLYNTDWQWAEINKEGTGLAVLVRKGSNIL